MLAIVNKLLLPVKLHFYGDNDSFTSRNETSSDQWQRVVGSVGSVVKQTTVTCTRDLFQSKM